jgi:hypothetical protein
VVVVLDSASSWWEDEGLGLGLGEVGSECVEPVGEETRSAVVETE